MINFIVWLLFGALVGWLASIVMRTDAQQGAMLNIIVGIVGAFVAGFLFNLFGIGGSNITALFKSVERLAGRSESHSGRKTLVRHSR